LERDRYYGYDKPDKVQQRQVFSSFVQVTPHVWIPTLVKLYNEFGQLGGDITYTNIAVNKGVPDKTFKR
jgi:outer membrane lipoprotein-sorting protein